MRKNEVFMPSPAFPHRGLPADSSCCSQENPPPADAEDEPEAEAEDESEAEAEDESEDESEIEVIDLISSSDEENVALDNSNASSAGLPHEALDFPDEEFNSGNFADFLVEAEQAHVNEFAEMPVERQDSSAWEEEVEMDAAAFEEHAERNFHFGNIRDLYPHLSPPARVRVPLVSP